MKKQLLLFLFPLIISTGLAQNNILRGIVKLQSSGAKPLEDVKISTFGAGHVYSNNSGQFELTFSRKKSGDGISLIVEKEGYELINDKALDNCVLRNDPDELLIVVMAKKGERNQQALLYYNIIVNNAEKGYDKDLKDIRSRLDALDEDDAERQVLRQQIAALQQEKEGLINQSEYLAKQLATVDLDQASALAKEAYEKFKNGDINAALAVLDSEILAKNLKDAKAEKANLKKELAKADSAFQQSIKNYIIKARFCIVDRQYEAAYENYLKAIEADSTDIGNLKELGDYCNEINHQKKAIRFYQQALKITKKEEEKAELLNDLAMQFVYNNEYSKAKVTFLESLEIYMRLVIKKPQQFKSGIARVHNNMGLMHENLKEYNKADTAYSTSIEIYRDLTRKNPKKFDYLLSKVLNNKGNVYKDLNMYDDARIAYQESLKVGKSLDSQKVQNKAIMASTLINLGLLNWRLNLFKESELAYLQSLEIYNHLVKENPQKYKPKLALILMNMGIMYMDNNLFDKAKVSYIKSLELYKLLSKENPERYEPDLAAILVNIANMYVDLKTYNRADSAFLESLKIRRRLARINPKSYEGDLARTLMNMGVMYWDLEAYSSAEKAYLESLEIRRRLAKVNPLRYTPEIAATLMNIGNNYYTQNKYVKAEEAYLESLEIYRNLAKKNPLRFNVELCRTLINISYLKQFLLEASLIWKFRDEGLRMIQDVQLIIGQSNNSIPSYKLFKQHADKLENYFSSFTKEDLAVLIEVNKTKPFANKIKATTGPADKVYNQEQIVTILEKALTKYPKSNQLIERTANENSSLAWYYLFTKQFPQAEQVALRGLQLDNSQEWINTNLALSLLYQGKLEIAKKLYLELKDTAYQNGTFKNVFLEDLAALEKEGITHKDVEVIRKILND